MKLFGRFYLHKIKRAEGGAARVLMQLFKSLSLSKQIHAIDYVFIVTLLEPVDG